VPIRRRTSERANLECLNPCNPASSFTERSHSRWEHSITFRLDRILDVVVYVKSDKLDFTIPYEYALTIHNYIQDYIVRLVADGSQANVILEVKDSKLNRTDIRSLLSGDGLKMSILRIPTHCPRSGRN
jgi:hypothetical protein